MTRFSASLQERMGVKMVYDEASCPEKNVKRREFELETARQLFIGMVMIGNRDQQSLQDAVLGAFHAARQFTDSAVGRELLR